jgi:capsule assembly protein Wzi
MLKAPSLRRERVACCALAMALQLGRPHVVVGSPLEFLPVGDPLEAELRTLDVLGPAGPGQPLRLARTGMRPLQWLDLDSLPSPDDVPGFAHRISLLRIRRALARDADADSPEARVPGRTPRLYQKHDAEGARFELSVGAEGAGEVASGGVRYFPDTGLHTRVALQTDRWLLYSHVVGGHQDTARVYSDPLFPGTDVIITSSESYVGYTAAGGRWGMHVGRSRWHWGPGEEGSLLLSKTAVALTGLALHARLAPIRADGMAFSATLRGAAGEQLAAHRLEWQPWDGLRVGLSEAARYQADFWRPLYLMGVIPYILVQRMHFQDEPRAQDANRNNILVGADVAWRVAPGTRVYGELLADDLHLVHADRPSKYATQLGWDGVGTFRGTRLVWGGEYTRVTRFVYTSDYGRDFVAQGRPLGFPIAPDARRMRVRAAWDFSPAWQVSSVATRTQKGENTLVEPFVEGSPNVNASRFQGVVEEARELEAGVRWWPAGGVDVALSAGYRWVDDAGHVAGARTRGAHGGFAFRLVR